jgi:hypothetical protein
MLSEVIWKSLPLIAILPSDISNATISQSFSFCPIQFDITV